MQRTLLIGGTGFIGKNLLRYLLEHDESSDTQLWVVTGRRERPADLPDTVRYERGDYRDQDFLQALFAQYDFTRVFHLASSSVPLTSNRNMAGDIADNLTATVGLLEVMRQNDCRHIIYFSSAGALYGDAFAPSGNRETDNCEPVSSYGITKWAAEHYIKLYQKNYGIEYLILRLSNVYGEHHTSALQGLINIALRKALRGETLEVWGDGSQSKDYIYVNDVSAMVHHLLVTNVKNDTLNIGSGESITLNQIVDCIKELESNFDVRYAEQVSTDVIKLRLDTSKIRSLAPQVRLTDLKNGLHSTYRWEASQVSRLAVCRIEQGNRIHHDL